MVIFRIHNDKMQVTPTLHCGSFFAKNLNCHSDENQNLIFYFIIM